MTPLEDLDMVAARLALWKAEEREERARRPGRGKAGELSQGFLSCHIRGGVYP